MFNGLTRLMLLAVLCCMGGATSVRAAEPVKTGEKRDTLLYIRTDPPGAKVLINGKEAGSSDGLFRVEPGSGTILVELEGRKPDKRQVIIRANAITRVEMSLDPKEGPKRKRSSNRNPRRMSILEARTSSATSHKARWNWSASPTTRPANNRNGGIPTVRPSKSERFCLGCPTSRPFHARGPWRC